MITLTTSGDSVVFVFDNNDHYLQQGTIEVPMNSLSLLIDSSDMVTFKKAASNDVFVSATLSELGMTKEQLISFYKENMVSEGGVPEEEIQAMIASATSGYADSVTFNSDNNYIEFYHDDTKVYELDASDFVIDGMIDDVRIETIGGVSYLVIDFNTASGKQDIQIPLTDIFNPSDYYTTAQTDTKIAEATSGKVDTDTYAAYTAATDAALSGKQDTLSAGTNIIIADNVISADIDAKGIEGGRGITVTTGETADTVSFNLPIYQGKGNYSLSLTQASGTSTQSYNNIVSGYSTVAIGAGLTVTNKYEAGLGVYNVNRPQSQSQPFGDSGYTLLTVGNGGGNAVNQKHNALEIRQNGDIYYANTNDTAHTDFFTKPMVKLQDAIDSKQDTLSAGTNITISGNVISAEGGGKAIEAGRGISITTGETADTINCTLSGGTLINISNNKINCYAPIKYGTGVDSIIVGSSTSTNKATGHNSIANGGDGNTANGDYSNAEGFNTQATKHSSHSEGWFTIASGNYSHTEGNNTKTTNESEHASGRFNNSVSASTTFGDSGNTLFSVGNGTADNARHNAFEIRQNGDIYITSGGTDIKLQDNLGSTIEISSAITSGDTNPVQGGVLYDKFDEIEEVTAAALNTLSDNFDGLKLKKVSQAQYDALISGGTVDNNTLYVVI